MQIEEYGKRIKSKWNNSRSTTSKFQIYQKKQVISYE